MPKIEKLDVDMPQIDIKTNQQNSKQSLAQENTDKYIQQPEQNTTLDFVLSFVTKMLDYYIVYLDYSLKFEELKYSHQYASYKFSSYDNEDIMHNSESFDDVLHNVD